MVTVEQRAEIRRQRAIIMQAIAARLRVLVTIPNVVAVMMVWSGIAILTMPDVYSVAVLNTATNGIINPQLYGAVWVAMGAWALGAQKTRIVLTIMQVPIWFHALWVAWWSFLTLGNPAALPVPYYLAVAIIMALIAGEMDE